jgi:predicted nucleotidyltransferase
MTPLVAAARELIHFLDAAGFKTCLIGGLVVQRWGEPRLTRDVDATVLADYGTEARVIDAVLGHFAARRPDALEFALANRILLVRASNGVDLDLSLAAFDFEREALDRATPYEFEPGVGLLTCSAEDLIVYKAVAARPRDVEDIRTVVIRQGRRLDVDRVRRWLQVFAELKEDPDLARPFEDALCKYAQPGR